MKIKIFDYVQKKYPNSDIEIVFTDRATCGWCKDVVRRIRKSAKEQPLGYDGVISDRIDANFTLGIVDGKPLKSGKPLREDPELIYIDKIFKEGCSN